MTSLFGLPEKVIHCKNCLMTNQKPFSVNESKNTPNKKKLGMEIHENGLCSACDYSFKKDKEIDWDKREKLLVQMLEKYRKNNGDYDCIVSGSGGKDSSTIAHLLKYKYNMNPLTVTYSPILYTEIGLKNHRAWINVGGFDNILFSPNGKITSLLAKEAFQNLLHPMQPFKYGIKSIAAKYAIKYGIKLVMFGESYVEYGSQESSSADSSPSYDLNWFINDTKDIFFGGTHFDKLKKKYQWLKDVDLKPYMPLRSSEVKKSELAVEFLGWYLKWNPQESYYYASENCGYSPDTQRSDATYGRYSAVDDKFEWLHYYCHYIKYGIGRCRFDTAQEIRNGHITREEAILLCKKFEGEVPKRYLTDCFNFMGLSEEQSYKIIDKFRSPHLWKKKGSKWIRKQELPQLD